MDNTPHSTPSRLDRFVRWFFNSSPTASMIEPHPSAPWSVPERPFWAIHAAFGAALVGALIVLSMFYSVVAGAVERGASGRTETLSHATVSATAQANPPRR